MKIGDSLTPEQREHLETSANDPPSAAEQDRLLSAARALEKIARNSTLYFGTPNDAADDPGVRQVAADLLDMFLPDAGSAEARQQDAVDLLILGRHSDNTRTTPSPASPRRSSPGSPPVVLLKTRRSTGWNAKRSRARS